jgi:hypothetical protein
MSAGVPRPDTRPQFLDVDTERWIAYLESRKDGLSERQAANVDLFVEHLRSERSGDVERYLAHQVPNPVYRRYGAVEWHLSANIHEWFNRMAGGSFPIYEMETDRFVVTDDLIVCDGVLKMTTTGSKLLEHHMELPAGGTESDTYLVYRRFAIFIPFEDGVWAGEDTYRDPPSIVKVS